MRQQMPHLNKVQRARCSKCSNREQFALYGAAFRNHRTAAQGAAKRAKKDVICGTAAPAAPPIGVWGGAAERLHHHRSRARRTACRRLRLARHAAALSHHRITTMAALPDSALPSRSAERQNTHHLKATKSRMNTKPDAWIVSGANDRSRYSMKAHTSQKLSNEAADD